MSSEDNNNLLESEGSQSMDWRTRAKESMREWNIRYCLWKNFDTSQLNLIKSFVGLTVFGKPETDEATNSELNIENMYLQYGAKEKSRIDVIVSQFQFENNQLNISHTLLYLSLDATCCVFRQIKFSDEVNFIDFDGRVYTSWQHFVKTNTLPKCEYMAPKNGIHGMGDEVEVNESPVSTVGVICDYIFFASAIAGVSLTAVSAAPVTAGCLLTSSATYSAGQSCRTLWDRIMHNQSISPLNLEAASCYMDIGTSFIYGASKLSKYSNLAASLIRGASYAATASTVTSFGLHLFILRQKIRDGEASHSDLLGLCIDIFLLYGAVSDVCQMRSSLSNLEVNSSTPPKGLSKGARKRWRKRQTKLRISASTSGTVTKVGAWDLKMFHGGLEIAGIAFKKLLGYSCPVIHEIYDSVCLIIEDFKMYASKRISPKVFACNLICHCENLLKLLQNNASEIKNTVVEFLQRHGIIASSKSVHEISNIVDDGVVGINNVNEYEEVLLEDDSATELGRSNDAIVHKMILEVVKNRVCRREVGTPEQLLSVFSQELASVVNEIEMKITQDYEDMMSDNIKSLGEEETKIFLPLIGINSKSDFANTIIKQTIENLESTDRVDVLIIFEKQLDELFLLYQELFHSMTEENDAFSIGALETCEVFNKSIEVIIQPITTFYTKSKKIYEVNVKFFGPKKTMILVSEAMKLKSVISEDYNDSVFLSLAIKNFNLDENKSRLLPHEKDIHQPIAEYISFTDSFKMETLLSICNFYVQRIDCSEKSLAKIYSFVTDKFIYHFQSLSNQENSTANVKESLNLNSTLLGKNNCNQLYRFLRETNALKIFHRVIELFKKDDFAIELIAEYYRSMHNVTDFHAKYLKHLVSDDGVTIYTEMIENREDIEKFKTQAEKLFNLNKQYLNVVHQEDNLVVLKNDDKYVVFQFAKNQPEALVMQVDLTEKH